jgi:subtilisin family serine protease
VNNPSRRRRVIVALVVVALAAAGQAGSPPAQAASPAGNGQYLVSFWDSPAASYAGGVSGLSATRAAAGHRFDAHAPAAQRYRDHLRGLQDRALAAAGVGASKQLYRYTAVNDAVAAELTADQVTKLRRDGSVRSVEPNQTFTADTISTPKFLGLDGDGGVWQKQFGGDAHAGEGMIVGVVDTGIWPESASFAPLSEPRPDQDVIDAKWHGTCDDDATGAAAIQCNDKLIGARWFGRAKPRTVVEGEFDSPRDYNGHGTHTAGTAAGDGSVDVTIAGNRIGSASGIAPAARVAVYKALWTIPGNGAAGTSIDIVAAIEASVLDGVDVLNYSISGITYTTNYPVSVALFNAAQAGVFIAASAGNNGDLGASQVNHNLPWVTTVAATTHDRGHTDSVTLGDGTTLTGTGVGEAVPSTDLVDSAQAGNAGVDPGLARLCQPGTLDPALVTGKIVLCARGVNARTEKSATVRAAGGVGMVLYNTTADVDDIDADYHSIPTVHLHAADGVKAVAYADGTDPTASLGAAQTVTVNAPEVATFSSYGPALAAKGDLLKPDIAAPGVDVIAPVAPPGNGGESFAAYSGTSMAAPHIAGLAALLRSKHPEWSPAAVRSAMMTTASQTDRSGGPILLAGVPATPLHYGAGQVEPAKEYNPGLIYDSGPEDWLAYMCAVGDLDSAACQGVPAVDPSDLNYPSIAVGDLVGSQTIVRTVTNTSSAAGVYQAQLSPPPGVKATVTPSTMVVLPGRKASFRVTLKRTTAAPNAFTFGSLTWKDSAGHAVRSPIAVRPVLVGVPARIVASGTSGSTAVKLRAGYDGTLATTTSGVIPATVTPVELTDPTGIPFDQTAPAETSHTGLVRLDVPAGTRLLALGIFAADLPPGTNADMEIYRWADDGTGKQVRTYLGGTVRTDAEEQVELYSPAPGRYDIYVDVLTLPGILNAVTVKLNTWMLATDVTAVSATPPIVDVREGKQYPVTFGWSGLQPGTRYLGVVFLRAGSTLLTRSILRIDTF